jgi:hypothetical protein
MLHHGLCRPAMSGTAPGTKRSAQASALLTSAGKRLAAIAGLLIATGQLAVNVRDGQRKELDRCFDAKFLDQLVSCNPQKRAVARAILKTCHFPKEDVDNILRQTSALDQGCPAGNSPAPPESPPPPATHNPLTAELRAKSLVETLQDASDFAAANSPEQSEQALTLYLGVLDKLSRSAKGALDPDLMWKYGAAMEKHDTQQAVKLLSSAFRPYLYNH